MVLVTSRKAVGVCLGMVEPLLLGALSAEASMQLLTDSAGSKTSWGNGEAAKLVAICGNNALAITILAGLVKNQYCSPMVRTCQENHIWCTCMSKKCIWADAAVMTRPEELRVVSHTARVFE